MLELWGSQMWIDAPAKPALCPAGLTETRRSASPYHGDRKASVTHVRRDKAALFQWVQGPPGDRSRRKQPGQAWR
jgi:hypothetical protein